MTKTTVQIEGMMCGMCEAHICDTIRNLFPNAKKVSASHSKGNASFLSEETPSEEMLKNAINATGYTFLSMQCEPYERKSLFHRK